MATETITTSCVIAGGGPAGMMCGFLLARAGVDVVVLEKHADFLRDFRGDTVHPSTLQNYVRARFARRVPPGGRIKKCASWPASIGDDRVMIADFSHSRSHCRFIAMMPQWDFLDFVADALAQAIPILQAQDLAKADGLMQDGDAIVGLDGQVSRKAGSR